MAANLVWIYYRISTSDKVACVKVEPDVISKVEYELQRQNPSLDVSRMSTYLSEQHFKDNAKAMDPMDAIPKQAVVAETGRPIPFYIHYKQPSASAASSDEQQAKRRRLDTVPPWFENICKENLMSEPSEDGKWFGEETKIPFTPIYVRKCYDKMADILLNGFDRTVARQSYVIKGTPGIGKTTMLYYLLWRCMQDKSPYQAILFAVGEYYFIARKQADGKWQCEDRQEREKVSQNGEKTIGLVDVSPEGKFEIDGKVQMGFNMQGPCSTYGLHRLVVVASAGSELSQLIGKDGDITMPKELYLPVWRKEHTEAWFAKKYNKTADLSLCGSAVPRLVVAVQEKQFDKLLQKFINKIVGKQSAAEKHENAKDAHTMVLLGGSTELSEDTAPDAEQTAGKKMGLASDYVMNKVVEEMDVLKNTESVETVVRMAPKTAPRIFEQLVKKHIMSESGLDLSGADGSCYCKLQTSQTGVFPIHTFRPNVLYVGKGGDQKSADLVLAINDVFYVMQITTAQKHDRINIEHLKSRTLNVHVPRDCKEVVFLYIVPTSPSSLTLDGQKTTNFNKKDVTEVVVSARPVLANLQDDVRQHFEPGHH